MFKKENIKDPQLFILVIFYLAIFIGFYLAIYQFSYNRSLWLDEATLANNIIKKGFFEITKPLEHGQVAPIGFLLVEKVMVHIFGTNEFALRLFPLLSYILSIPLFYVFSKEITKNSTISLISTSIYSQTEKIIYYSSEVKQYGTDILWSILILYFTLKLDLRKKNNLICYALIGGISIFFSNIAIIILFVAGIYVVIKEVKINRNWNILFPLFSWVIFFFTYYYFFIHDHPHKQMMINYWAKSFLPLNPFSGDFFAFLYNEAFREIFTPINFGVSKKISFIISCCSIVFALKHKNYKLLYFCLAPIFLHLILSSLKMYPFSGRLILYIIPLILLLFSVGLYQIYCFPPQNKRKFFQFILIAPVIILLFNNFYTFPIEREEIKKSLNYIQQNSRENEVIYIYYGSKGAFSFYRDSQSFKVKNPLIFGSENRDNLSRYNAEILSLKGKVWLLFSHVYPFSKKKETEETYMINFLKNEGGEVLDFKKYKGSSLYYVNMKQSEKS